MTLMVSQQVESLVTREHFDLHMGHVDQRFQQVDKRFQQMDQRFQQVDTRFDRVESRFAGLEKSQAAQTALLTVITLAVVIPLVQSVVAG
ncbi:MAG: hypothetical protein RLP45_08485 [Haliea sp.]